MADYKKSSVHCHSTMCDGKNTLQEMASAACAKGLTTLGFTGHSYTQRDREYCMSPSRTAQYKATIAKLKTEYKGKVDILCGIEWDLLSEDKRTGYDYWIGSAHHLYGKNTGKYYEIDFRPQDLHDCIYDDFDGDPLAAVEAYFAEVEKWKGNRPLTFSRYAGVGSHRYPVGFSGDSVISWESLQFQPYFTNTASNVGYGWWSHDIGGHMMGIRDDELMARWVEYGVFSPINRLHSTDNPFNGKEPWKFDKITQGVMEDYLRLRHGMVPYLYTMNHRANYDDLPLIQPMSHR